MNTKRFGDDADPITIVFKWLESGINLLQSPCPVECYPIPLELQRSLRDPSSPPQTPSSNAKPLIPISTLANLLHRTPWGNLNLNFEPGPDRKLRTYFSLSAPRLPSLTDPVRVTLFCEEKECSRDFFTNQGTYQSPPLSPGAYRFQLNQLEKILIEINVEILEPID